MGSSSYPLQKTFAVRTHPSPAVVRLQLCPCRSSLEGCSTLPTPVPTWPHAGYFPSPAKSYVVCPHASEPIAKATFDATKLPVQFSRKKMLCWRLRWLPHQARLLANPPHQQVDGIKCLTAVALHFPHSAYANLVSCLSTKWQCVFQGVPDIGPLPRSRMPCRPSSSLLYLADLTSSTTIYTGSSSLG